MHLPVLTLFFRTGNYTFSSLFFFLRIAARLSRCKGVPSCAEQTENVSEINSQVPSITKHPPVSCYLCEEVGGGKKEPRLFFFFNPSSGRSVDCVFRNRYFWIFFSFLQRMIITSGIPSVGVRRRRRGRKPPLYCNNTQNALGWVQRIHIQQ